MFAFQAWRKWLEAKGTELKAEGFEVSFRCGPDDGPKPGMVLELVGRSAMGGFENWITGETDYTVMAPASRDAKLVAHRWGVVVSDETFEDLFHEFLACFRHHESSN